MAGAASRQTAKSASICQPDRTSAQQIGPIRVPAPRPHLRHPYNKRPMNLIRALLTVSGFTLLSRVTGLARETLIARAFGASQYTDAVYVAFRIPNLLRRISAEGAFSHAFVPILPH